MEEIRGDALMHWVLQENIFREEAYDALIDVLRRFEIPFSEHKVIPFVGELMPEPDLSGESAVICIGSYSMRHSARKFGWTPGVFDIEDQDFRVQLERWGTHMLNHDSMVVPFKDAVWPAGEDRFVRPIHDSKVFAGKMFDWEDFNRWQYKVCALEEDYGDSLTANTIVQVADPKKIYAEYRCWVVGGKIVTMSRYKLGDKVHYTNMDDLIGEDARNFAYEMIKIWSPHEAYCLDVCSTPDGWKIVEINTLNSCGFYAANLTSLVLSLEDYRLW